MVKRWSIRIAVALAGFIVFCFFAGYTALNTDETRRALFDRGARAIETAAGVQVSYDSLSGAWPQRIVANGLVLSDADGVWMTADQAELAWRPLRLLAGSVDVKAFVLDGGVLIRPPNVERTSPGNDETPRKGVDLPPLRIERLSINQFALGETVVDGGAIIDIESAFAGGGPFSEDIAFKANIAAVLPVLMNTPLADWTQDSVTASLDGVVNAEDMTLSLKMASVTGENVVVRLLGAQLSEDLNLTGDLSIALDASAAP
ncbi:MAG: hypothetical protein AAGC95_18225, partial [Pseudomonadota bacterium]